MWSDPREDERGARPSERGAGVFFGKGACVWARLSDLSPARGCYARRERGRVRIEH
jgi:hypothetical protein